MTKQEAEKTAKTMKVGDNSIMPRDGYTLVKVARNLYKVGVMDVDGGFWKSRAPLSECLDYIYSR